MNSLKVLFFSFLLMIALLVFLPVILLAYVFKVIYLFLVNKILQAFDMNCKEVLTIQHAEIEMKKVQRKLNKGRKNGRRKSK